MKCEDIQELLCIYWDLPETDLRRQTVDEHTRHCAQCAEEFDLWLESNMLIQSVAGADEDKQEPTRSIASSVMSRIYEDESWKLPVAARSYRLSYAFRRNVTMMLAACLALFAFTFLYSMTQEQPVETMMNQSAVFGQMGDPVVVSSAASSDTGIFSTPTTAVASLKGFNEPFMAKVGPIRTVNDYLLFVSIFGLTSLLLVLNWLQRIKS